MKTKVKVTAKGGQIFFPNLNEDKTPKLGKDGEQYGYVRLQQDELKIGNGPVTTNQVSILQQFSEKAANLLKEGMELPGNIVITDATKPFFTGQDPLEVPVRDENGKETEDTRVVTSGGKPVYRDYSWDATGTKVDFKLEYDKVESAKAVAAGASEAGSTKLG
jgi:hypothetical protein